MPHCRGSIVVAVVVAKHVVVVGVRLYTIQNNHAGIFELPQGHILSILKKFSHKVMLLTKKILSE